MDIKIVLAYRTLLNFYNNHANVLRICKLISFGYKIEYGLVMVDKLELSYFLYTK